MLFLLFPFVQIYTVYIRRSIGLSVLNSTSLHLGLILFHFLWPGFSFGTSQDNSTKHFVVEVGANISLECRLHFTKLSRFEFVAINNETPIPILINDDITQPMRTRYRVNNRTSGQYEFIIDCIDRKHAGKYSCKSFHSTVHQTAYLSVIGKSNV